MKIQHTFAVLTLAAFGFSTQIAHAMPISGYSNVSKIGDIYTFTFDIRNDTPADPQPNEDRDGDPTGGLSFISGDGLLGLIATGSGKVRQDWPENGGLGILGSGCGLTTCTDNIEGDDTIQLAFNLAVDLIDFSLNGMMNASGHQDASNGRLFFGTDLSTQGFDQYEPIAANWDGDGSNNCIDPISCTVRPELDLNAFNTIGFGGGGNTWEGYIESISVRISDASEPSVDVPEPSVIALFAAGLIGIGFARRRKA